MVDARQRQAQRMEQRSALSTGFGRNALRPSEPSALVPWLVRKKLERLCCEVRVLEDWFDRSSHHTPQLCRIAEAAQIQSRRFPEGCATADAQRTQTRGNHFKRRRVQKFGIQGLKRDHIEMCWRATDLLERKFGRKRGHREVRLDRIGGADLCDIGCKCERLDAVFTQCTQRKGSNPLREDIAAGGDEQRI